MAERQRAGEDGIDPSWGMSGQGTRLMLGLIEEQGKIDWDEEGPVVPASTDPDEDPFPSAQQRWQAENESRLRAMEPDRVRLTGVKFSSNDHWLVLPSEARAMANALRAATRDQARAVLEADHVEMRAITDPSVDDPPDLETAISNILTKARQFADYCERASEYGGFRVD
jgi:hypothetical protein